MRRTAAQTREHILETAHELFYWDGIRATGIDRVAAAAEVAPTTLYRLFSSKDDLVAAYVQRIDLDTRERVVQAVARAGSDPRDRTLAAFRQLTDQQQPEGFRGCALMLTVSEFPDEELPAHRGAIAHKEWARRYLADLARDLPGADPQAVADGVLLAVEGANATAQSLGAQGPVRQARALVELILDAAGRWPGTGATLAGVG